MPAKLHLILNFDFFKKDWLLTVFFPFLRGGGIIMPNIQCKSITRNGCDTQGLRECLRSLRPLSIPSKLFSVQFLVGTFILSHSVIKNRGLNNLNNLSPLTSYLYRPLLNRRKCLNFCLIWIKYDIVMAYKELHVSCAFRLTITII